MDATVSNALEGSVKHGKKYQHSGARGTRSLPAMPHPLQHLTTRLIQNGRWGLEKGQTLDKWTLRSTFDN